MKSGYNLAEFFELSHHGSRFSPGLSDEWDNDRLDLSQNWLELVYKLDSDEERAIKF
jgi:hypothetical protein